MANSIRAAKDVYGYNVYAKNFKLARFGRVAFQSLHSRILFSVNQRPSSILLYVTAQLSI